MEDSKAPPDRTSPASNALEDPTTDEFGLASPNRAGGTDLGGKPKEDKPMPHLRGVNLKQRLARKENASACLHCLSPKEDPLFWRETRLQAVPTLMYPMCLQGCDSEGCASDKLHGYAR
ncbi:hypothetical protein QL093DRAFT_1115411 [Fusarium oxysporum]|nr:hypothetical protein QL093DRAFT_1115411 [Fusarium oxysporum]